MKRPIKKPEPRVWRVSMLRKRLEYLGRVVAIDHASAEATAVEEFKLNDKQCKRLMLQE